MKTAFLWAELSYAKRLKVGALIVKDNVPISCGYNGTPKGRCNVCEGPDGKTLPTVRHAEINALKALQRSPNTSQGAILFVTHSPCANCMDDIIDSGVSAVVFSIKYRETDHLKELVRAGVRLYQCSIPINADDWVLFEYVMGQGMFWNEFDSFHTTKLAF